MNGAPDPDTERQIVETAWQDQARWSQLAGGLKSSLSAWRTLAAAAGVIGALLETLAGTLAAADPPWAAVRGGAAVAGAVVLALVPYILKTRASRERVREWVRARAVSEALKETVYRFLLRVPPFEREAAPAALVARCQAVKEKARDLSGLAALAAAPHRERPLVLSIEGYVAQRVNDQIERYYRPKGRENAAAGRRLHALEFWLGLAAVVMGAAAGAGPAAGLPRLALIAPWVAVVTTAGAAVTAHIAASRRDLLAMTYAATAERLTSLRDAWRADPGRLTPERIVRFVDECEHAISTENEAWLADWTIDPADRG